LYFYKFCF